MTDSWATFGADLHLELRGSGVRAALERALRDAVRTGRLLPGSRLPSSRSLASDLGIARNTVAEAYGQLVAEGWLTARHGSGTRVADKNAEARSLMATGRAGTARLRPSEQPGTPSDVPVEAPAVAYDLRPGTPDLSAFPRAAWLSAAKRALTAAPNDALGHADPRGRVELRSALAEYLARARGVRATPDRILICSGFVQGLALLTAAEVLAFAERWRRQAYRETGRRFLYPADELYLLAGQAVPRTRTYDGFPQLANGAGLMRRFADGWRRAQRTLPGRAAAVAWARETGGLIIEDDYDGEFRYDRQPVGALQDLDPDRVVYIGTASKSLAPGLRLAWMVLPPVLLDPVAAAKSVAGGDTGTLDQLTLAEVIRSGTYDRHVRRSRYRYRSRRDRLVAALAERAPQVRVTGIAAGLHAVLEMPPGAGSEQAIVARAATGYGLALNGLDRYRYTPAAPGVPTCLVVGYGTPPDHAFSGALDALCAAVPRNAAQDGSP